MLAISSNTRLIIWIIIGISSLLSAVLFGVLQPNIVYLLRKTRRKPSPKHLLLWISFSMTTTVTVLGTAIASSAPELVLSTATPISQPALEPTSTVIPTPESLVTLLSDHYLDKNLDLAILFSVADYRKKATLETKINLFNALQKSSGVAAFFRETKFSIRDIEFNSNGSLFAASGCSVVDEQGHCTQGEILIWEISEKGSRRIGNIVAHHDLVNTLIFSPDNKTLISGSCGGKDSPGKCDRGELIAWDISNPKNPIANGNSIHAHTGFVQDLGFVPGTNTLFSVGCGQMSSTGDCTEGQLLSWEITNDGLRQDDFSISLQAGAIKTMEFSHSGNLLIMGTEDGRISLWRIIDTSSDPELVTELNSIFTGTPSFAFGPDDKMFFSANSDNALRSWNILPDYSVSEGPALDAAQNSISFDSTNNVLLGGNDKALNVWDVSVRDHFEQISDPYTAHNSEVYIVKSSPDGGIWVSGAKDGSVIVWDFWNQDINTLLGYSLSGHNSDVLGLSTSKDEKMMASGSCGKWNKNGRCSLGEIIIWDVTNPAAVTTIGRTFFGHTEYVYSLAFSPNNKLLVSGGGDGNIILWDINDPQSPVKLIPPLAAHEHVVQSLAFTPDGKILASGGDDGKLILWDISNSKSPKVINSFFTGDRRVYDIEFRSNDYGFIAADGLQKIKLSDTPSVTRIDGSDSQTRSIAIDPKLSILATANRNGDIYLWNITNLNSLLKYDRSLHEQDERILDLTFGENQQILASGSDNASIAIWYFDYPDGSLQPKPIASYFLEGHAQNVLRLEFLSDDKFLVSSGGDDRILVWNLDPNSWLKIACRIITRNYFSTDEWAKYFPNEPYHSIC